MSLYGVWPAIEQAVLGMGLDGAISFCLDTELVHKGASWCCPPKAELTM
jgi:hypothetical protein